MRKEKEDEETFRTEMLNPSINPTDNISCSSVVALM